MNCPNGCSAAPERYKRPVEIEGLGTMRRHRCPNCRRMFISLQRVILGKYATILLQRIEEREEAASEGAQVPSGAGG